jgi:Domain of unknown function (DUF4157)
MGSLFASPVRAESNSTSRSPGPGRPLVRSPRRVMSTVLTESGRPLDAEAQARFGRLFGSDFSRVRIHSGDSASASTLALRADAYTVGRHVVMGPDWNMGTISGRRLLAHELAHVVQQCAAAVNPEDDIPLASLIEEREADQAVEATSNDRAVMVNTRAAPRLGLQPRPTVRSEVADLPWSRYVDRYQEVYYDLEYRPKKPGHLSEWLRVRYADGTLIDIDINEITEATLSGDDMVRAMANATVGRGDRIFPATMNRETTPRLYAARRSALEAMDEYNVQFITATIPAVLFIITAAAAPVAGTGRGVPPSVTRRPVSRSRALPPATGTAAQSAEQIGAEIGGSVAGQATGKMASIAEKVTARGLSQGGAATATETAVRTLGLRTGPRVILPDGNVVITSVQLGSRQPVLVVQPNGSVFRAVADLVLEGLTVTARNVTRI